MTIHYKLPAIRKAVAAMPWALLPEKLEAMLEVIEVHAAHGSFTAEEIRARVGEPKTRAAAQAGTVAVLPLFGIIAQRMNLMAAMSGGTSTQQFADEFDAAVADPNVSAIVLLVDSPGGNVQGTPELARKIYDARGTKPIVAQVEGLMASAAYWIASAADEIVATPSSEIGSIGVYSVHMDTSAADAKVGVKYTLISAGKYKTEGNPYEPLSDEARAAQQEAVDAFYTMFVQAVAQHRGASVADVRGGYGEGRMLIAKPAKAAGLIDRIGTLDETVARLTRSGGRPAARAASAVHLHLTPAADVAAVATLTQTIAGTRPRDALAAAAGDAVVVALPPEPHRPTQAKEQPVDTNTAAPSNGAGTDLQAALAAERKRAADVRELGRSLTAFGVSDALIEQQVNSGATVEQASLAFNGAIREQAKTTPHISVGADRAGDRNFESIGEQLQSVIRASRGAGRDPRLDRINAAVSGMNEGVGSDGGFFLEPQLLPGVIEPVYTEDPILSRVTRIPVGQRSNGVAYNVVDESSRATGSRWGGIQMAWGAEGDSLTASKAKLRRVEHILKKITGACYLTEEQLEDAPAALSLVERAFQEELRFMLTDAIFNGKGAGQPLGFLNAGCVASQAIEGTQTIANSAQFLSLNLTKMLSRMPAALWGEAIWLYQPELLPYLMNAVTGTNGVVPIFMPAGGFANKPFDTILGRPAFASEFCAAVGTPGDIVLVAPSQYHLAEKGGAKQAMSAHVRFLNDEQTLKITYRCDGKPVWNTTLTPYKGAASRAPFLTLATRS